MLPGRHFVLGCAIVAAGVLAAGRFVAMPLALLAAEVFATIFGLFVFGSFKYQIHYNALTYGMLLIIAPALPTPNPHVARRDLREWLDCLGSPSPPDVRRTRRPDPCGHDVVHPRIDPARVGDRADSAARSRDVLHAAPQPRRHSAHRRLCDRGR